MEFSHLNAEGRARMVDVGGKTDTRRVARAEASVYMESTTLEAIRNGAIVKGDVLAVAQVAGIMAAKRTPELIPMCHPLMIEGVEVDFTFDLEQSALRILVTVKTSGKTGVEMEAMTAAATAALTVYDMAKAVDRWMTIGEVRLLEKSGGKSGHQLRPPQGGTA